MSGVLEQQGGRRCTPDKMDPVELRHEAQALRLAPTAERARTAILGRESILLSVDVFLFNENFVPQFSEIAAACPTRVNHVCCPILDIVP